MSLFLRVRSSGRCLVGTDIRRRANALLWSDGASIASKLGETEADATIGDVVGAAKAGNVDEDAVDGVKFGDMDIGIADSAKFGEAGA